MEARIDNPVMQNDMNIDHRLLMYFNMKYVTRPEGSPANEIIMKLTYLSPGIDTETMDTPYVISVDEIQQKMHIKSRVANEQLLIRSIKVPLLFTFSSVFSFLHFIAIMSYVFGESVSPFVLAAISTHFTAFEYFRFTKSHRKLSGNIHIKGRIAIPKTAKTLSNNYKNFM